MGDILVGKEVLHRDRLSITAWGRDEGNLAPRGEREGDPDLVEGIRDATQQARALIRDLLEYSRAGRGQLDLEEVPAAVVVDEALERLAGAIELSHARIDVGPLPVVLADRANLCRVFQNLVGNAVKFTREGPPQVRVDAERDAIIDCMHTDEFRVAVKKFTSKGK